MMSSEPVQMLVWKLRYGAPVEDIDDQEFVAG
jgi:hypothetical protein